MNNPQSTEVGSARLLTGDLILNFEEVGIHTVTLSTTDGYATNSYEIIVNVYDSLPFYVSKTDDGSGYLSVNMVDTYETQTPTASFALTDAAPTFTVISRTRGRCATSCPEPAMGSGNTIWTCLAPLPAGRKK